jgi:hypothetical protein
LGLEQARLVQSMDFQQREFDQRMEMEAADKSHDHEMDAAEKSHDHEMDAMRVKQALHKSAALDAIEVTSTEDKVRWEKEDRVFEAMRKHTKAVMDSRAALVALGGETDATRKAMGDAILNYNPRNVGVSEAQQDGCLCIHEILIQLGCNKQEAQRLAPSGGMYIAKQFRAKYGEDVVFLTREVNSQYQFVKVYNPEDVKWIAVKLRAWARSYALEMQKKKTDQAVKNSAKTAKAISANAKAGELQRKTQAKKRLAARLVG